MPSPIPSRWAAPLGVVLLCVCLGACRQGSQTEQLLSEARDYRAKGDPKAAVIQLKNALQQTPNHAGARMLLGELYIEQGDPISAEKELRRAATLGAAAGPVRVALGRALLMQGQFERLLDEIVAEPGMPQRATLFALRANALLGLGKTEQAKGEFEAALEADATSADALLGQARIALLEHAPERTAQLLARALAAHPDDVDSLRFQGDLLRMQGKPAEALLAYQHILKLRPTNAQVHIDIANLRIEAGKFDEARRELAAARKTSPASLSLYYAQALLDFREGKHAAALESLQQILRSAPEHMPSILLSGAVQLALGAPQQAENHLRKFLAANPNHPYASKLLATIALEAGNPDAALNQLAPLLSDGKADVETLAIAGEASLRGRHFSRAAEYFEQASALDPTAPALRTALGISRLGTGDNARAVAELERAAALDTKTPRARTLLVMTYLRSNDTVKALALVQAMEHDGDNPLVQNLKGGVLMARNDPTGARNCFEKALVLEPSYLPAMENLAQLDRIEKHPELAKKRFLAALDKDHKSVALIDALAKLAIAQGSTGEAQAWMERANRDNPDALAPALRLVDVYLRSGQKQKALVLAQKTQAGNPNNPDALGMLAQAQYANEDYPAALESYTKLGVLLPNSAAPSMHIARVQLTMNNEAAAQTAIGKALALNPDLLDAHIVSVGLLLARKNYVQAQAEAVTLQKRHADSPVGYKLAGDIALAQNQAMAAVVSYERAFALSKIGPLLIQIHSALLQAGKTNEAEARMALWFKDHPADVPTRLYFASSKAMHNDLKGAMQEFETVLKHDPTNVIALNDLAWSSLQQNDPHALAYAERAYHLAADNPVVLDTLGWVLMTGGNSVRALPLLQKASTLAPKVGEIRYHLGVALAKHGDKPGARRELERVLASDKDFPQREQVKALLATL